MQRNALAVVHALQGEETKLAIGNRKEKNRSAMPESSNDDASADVLAKIQRQSLDVVVNPGCGNLLHVSESLVK